MLPTATLVIATYLIVQLCKPALSLKILPQSADWSNNALRALVFVVAYALVVINTIVAHRLDWAGAWGLIPAAAAVAGLAIASYHILADASVNGASASGSFVSIAGEPLKPLAAPTADASTPAPARTERGTFAKRQSSAPIAVSAPLQTPTAAASPMPTPHTVATTVPVVVSSPAPADPAAPTGT